MLVEQWYMTGYKLVGAFCAAMRSLLKGDGVIEYSLPLNGQGICTTYPNVILVNMFTKFPHVRVEWAWTLLHYTDVLLHHMGDLLLLINPQKRVTDCINISLMFMFMCLC